LIVEDSRDDFELLVRELELAGYEVDAYRVDRPDAMRAALGEPWDLVISDWSLPGFSACEVLALVRERLGDLPFLIVSGVIDEELAVEALRAGAHDFMSKGRMARLGPAVERELREARLRREHERVREQLAIAERMASVGLLAAGVAHEINNPLATIVANLELAARDLAGIPRSAPFDALLESVTDARTAAVRIRDLVADLALFSRRAHDATAPVDLHRVLDSTLRVAGNEIRHRARLVRHFSPVPPIEANESRLGQVFLHLIVNALQAIPEGRADDHEICVATSLGNDGRVVIEVRDTGVGMPAEVRQRLFTPFFTTKQRGESTGLGLSICYRIVSSLGGEITVESQPGHGTRLRVHLPVTQRTIALPAPAPEPRGQVRGGRILVVDDDLLITAALVRWLRAPHRVVAKHSGEDALALLRAGERFDVILCDVMMPEMSGVELYRALRAHWPEQANAVIFLSAGAFTEDMRAFLDSVPNPQLAKPFEMRSLITLIEERLR
jgi:signal transduction histidine kinase